MPDATTTVEVLIAEGEVIRVEGLQRDARRRSDLRITIPDGRTILAHGRHPTDDGWEVYFEDHSDTVGGSTLGMSIALLMGHKFNAEEPEWLDRFDDAVSLRGSPRADIAKPS